MCLCGACSGLAPARASAAAGAAAAYVVACGCGHRRAGRPPVPRACGGCRPCPQWQAAAAVEGPPLLSLARTQTCRMAFYNKSMRRLPALPSVASCCSCGRTIAAFTSEDTDMPHGFL
eukprot:359409-Chlamydomonas_euryale.AAC.2